MKKTITILILLLTVGFLSFSQDIKPISPLFKNLQSPSFSFMIGGNPWIYKGTAFNPTPWTELAGWTNVKDTLNNYFTKSIVQAKIDSLANVKQDTITLTTIGTSGAATFIGSTLNIPQYSGGAEPGHDSLTIAPGSTGYFDVNYPQIFSGQKLIDSLGVMNTKIDEKENLSNKENTTVDNSTTKYPTVNLLKTYAHPNIISKNYDFQDLNNLYGNGVWTSYQPINSPTGSGLEESYSIIKATENSTAGSEIALSYYGTSKDRMFFRTQIGSAWSPYKEIWHSGNFDPATKAPASGSDNYVQVSPDSLQLGNIDLYGDVKINSLSKQPRADINYVFEGDSRTAVGTCSQDDYPNILSGLSNFVNIGNFYNVATGGNSISNIISQYNTEVFPLRPTGAINKSYLFVMIGINDLTVSSPNASSLASDLISYCNTATSDGFKVILLTVFYRQDFTIIQESARNVFNDILRQNASSFYMLVDLEQIFPPSSSSLFYYDVVHLKETGNYLISQHINSLFSLGNIGNTISYRTSYQDVFTPNSNEFKINGTLLLNTANNIPFTLNSLATECYINLKNSDSDSNYGVLLRSFGNNFGIYTKNGVIPRFNINGENGNVDLGYEGARTEKLAVNGDAFLNGFANTTAYKLSGVDLYSSLTANTIEKWDGSKHTSISIESGYFYSDGTNTSWIKTVPQSLSGTTPTLNASNGVNANLSISGATTLTLSNLITGTSGTIYLTNNASVYRIKIAGYTLTPASNVTYDSTGILLPASSVYTYTSIGWYYNGTTVQIHKADYNTTTY